MSLYHESVIEYINKERKKEALRDLIFLHNLFCKNELIDGKRTNELVEEISLNQMDLIIKDILAKLFSKTYLYVELHDYIKTLDNWIRTEKTNYHLIRFKKTYEDLIYGRSKDKAEAY